MTEGLQGYGYTLGRSDGPSNNYFLFVRVPSSEPNGSYTTFGGTSAAGPGSLLGSQVDPDGTSASWDSTCKDLDGRKAIRIMNHCRNANDFSSPRCQWYDNLAVLSMERNRWYSSAESLGGGTIVLLGGFVNCGYINCHYPNVEPQFECRDEQCAAAENTFEFFPSNGPNFRLDEGAG